MASYDKAPENWDYANNRPVAHPTEPQGETPLVRYDIANDGSIFACPDGQHVDAVEALFALSECRRELERHKEKESALFKENCQLVQASLESRLASHAEREGAVEYDDQTSVDIIKNLAMLVRRLCYKHPNDKLTDQAIAYLHGEKLEGSILRAPAPSPAEGLAFDGPSFFGHLQQQGLAMPPGVLSRLISYANCNRCELTPQDSRFLAGVIDELTRTTGSTSIASALRSHQAPSRDAGWVSVEERLPDIPDPLVYFPARAFFKDSKPSIATINWPGHWKKEGGEVPFTHWTTVLAAAPGAGKGEK